MRVIKQNTLRYETFYKSLPSISSLKNGGVVHPGANSSIPDFNEDNSFNELISLQNDLTDLNEIKQMADRFCKALKKILPVKNYNIFLFDNTGLTLNPINIDNAEDITLLINKSYKEGILEWVFESREAKIIPDLNQYRINGTGLNYLVFPILSGKIRKGLLTIISTFKKLPSDKLQNVIRLMLDLVYSRIEGIKLKEELAVAYKDQQVYQSKLINDYKLSAVGELTNGIAEEILTPLQVIISHIDLLKKERTRLTNDSTAVIKNQVNKIDQIIKRLVKFASINNENLKIYPCGLNSLIEEGFTLFASTLENNGLEYHLDLNDNLPRILSHPNYIYQMLTNILTIISSAQNEKGGILVQTRVANGKILVKIIFTEMMDSLKNKNDVSRLNLRIINNIMKKHEGELKVATNPETGTIILLSFPIKRKLRK